MKIHHAHSDQDLLWGLSDTRGDLRSFQAETVADQRLMWATAVGAEAAAEARRLHEAGGALQYHHIADDYHLRPDSSSPGAAGTGDIP